MIRLALFGMGILGMVLADGFRLYNWNTYLSNITPLNFIGWGLLLLALIFSWAFSESQERDRHIQGWLEHCDKNKVSKKVRERGLKYA